MKNNSELQTDVQDAIKWEPLMHAAEVGVSVKDGIVTLSGTVDSYGKKLEAEKAAKSVSGVSKPSSNKSKSNFQIRGAKPTATSLPKF